MFTVKSIPSLVTVMFLLSPCAFAQHGSVNGPVTTGPLNPASGSTSISYSAFKKAQGECYTEMLKDMLDPFLNLRNLPASDIQIKVGTNLREEYGNEHEHQIITLSVLLKNNQSEFAMALKKKGYTTFAMQFLADQEGLNDRRETTFRSVHPITIIADDEYTLGTLSGLGMPSIDVNQHTHVQNDYDSISHLMTGSHLVVESTQLTAGFIGRDWNDHTYHPADPSQIPMKNYDDLSNSNFSVNGTKFFQCVESKL